MLLGSKKLVHVAIADDHTLMRNALARLISSFEEYTVVFEASNGKEMIEYISNNVLPDIVLLDISMPEMNGFKQQTGFLLITRK